MDEEKEFTITKFSSGVSLAKAIESAVEVANKRAQENYDASNLYHLVKDILKEGETMDTHAEQQEAADTTGNTAEQLKDEF